MGFKAGVWALSLRQAKEEKEKEKFPHMCENRPLTPSELLPNNKNNNNDNNDNVTTTTTITTTMLKLIKQFFGLKNALN